MEPCRVVLWHLTGGLLLDYTKTALRKSEVGLRAGGTSRIAAGSVGVFFSPERQAARP